MKFDEAHNFILQIYVFCISDAGLAESFSFPYVFYCFKLLNMTLHSEVCRLSLGEIYSVALS